ncbi:Uncharacterized protein M6B38_211245 [Iris pallida]|uniref:DUF4378 domain-containing protein n=1 Tax=Iris pallida TaxID=29817 RepID=A0AAX6E4F4_IRIPA|nr:Uncharacterized protein M6B38_211245 [Iris pallida]
MKTTIASPTSPPKQSEVREFNDSLGSDESREVAKEITRRMQQYLSSHRRDEALLSSSALSNGYVGDVSSFNEEGCCIASDSEAATPTSRHPWDYNNGFGSPYSISSFSRVSSSPEPSVVKEAKKRLSERWAMITSNGIYEEPNQMRRSSSTLGEMLSFPKVKTEEGSDNLNISSRRSCGGEQGMKPSIGCFSSGGVKVRCGEDAPRNLPRSKSLPISSSVSKNVELNEVVPNALTCKSIVPKEVAMSKNGVSSFKGKLSSFFSRSKKSGTEKHIPSPSVGTIDILNSSREETCKRNDASSESFCLRHPEASMLINSEMFGGASSTSNSLNDGQKHVTHSAKQGSLSSDKSRACEISRDSQDQPSPISVLETQFEDDSHTLSLRSISAISGHPQALSRSSPIESISRTLTRDSPHLGRPLSNSSKLSKVLSKECEEQERFAFVQKLLSSASLLDSGDSTVFARWHSLDSPLDPTLLDEFLDRKEEEAKCRERRSNQRLLFDCVNAALLDIGWSTMKSSHPYTRPCGGALGDGKKCFLVAEEVWRLVRDWFSSVDKQVSCEGENRNLTVEGLVKQDVAGSGWSESMRSEIDEFSKEIGREVLEDLLKEVLADLTDVCLL